MAKKGLLKTVGGIKIRRLPPVRDILATFAFDRETCMFLYKPSKGTDKWTVLYNRRLAGKPAGYRDATGYVRLKIKGQNCAAHRLVWKVITGDDPVGLVDHINGIRDDNRIENLRDVTPSGNALNAIKGRWLREKERRADLLQRERAEATEKRELAQLARLKEKYET